MYKKIQKISMILLSLTIVLLLLLSIITQTPFFKNWLKGEILRQINPRINGNISISELNGNLFTNVILHDLQLEIKGDSVLFVPELEMHYEPWKILFNEVYISDIRFKGVESVLTKSVDTLWTINDIIIQDTTNQPVIDTADTSEAIEITIRQCRLFSSKIKVQSTRREVPSQIQIDTLLFSGFYTSDEFKFNLDRLKLTTNKPQFALKKMHFILFKNQEGLHLQEFYLQTGRNSAEAAAAFKENPEIDGEIYLKVPSLHLSEFEMFLPDLTFSPKPTILFESEWEGDSLSLDLTVKDKSQEIHLDGLIENLAEFLSNGDIDILQYRMSADIERINLGALLNQPDLQTDINGKIRIHGNGLSPQRAMSDFYADFSDIILSGRTIKDLEIAGSYRQGNGNLRINISDKLSEMMYTIDFDSLFKSPHYNFYGDINHLDLRDILNNEELLTDINVEFNFQAEGQSLEDLKGELMLRVFPSLYDSIRVDSAYGKFHLAQKAIKIDTLLLKSPIGKASLYGLFRPDSLQNINFNISATNFETLKQFIPADSLEGNLDISGKISGTLDSLIATIDLTGREIIYNQIYTDSISATNQIKLQGKSITINSDLEFSNSTISGQPVANGKIKSLFTEDSLNLDLDITQSDSVRMDILGQISWQDSLQVVLESVQLDFYENQWKSESPDSRIVWNEPVLKIDNLNVNSLRDSSSYLDISGYLNFKDTLNLDVSLNNFSLKMIDFLIPEDLTLEGYLSYHLQFGGTAENPDIRGKMNIRDLQVDLLKYNILSGQHQLSSQQFEWEFDLQRDNLKLFSFSGNIPANLSFEEFKLEIPRTARFNVHAQADSLPVNAVLDEYFQLEEIKGLFTCDLRLSNTLQDPRIFGFLDLQNGAVKVTDYGIDYRDISFNIQADSTRILLQKLEAHRDKGYIQVDGTLNLGESIIDGKFESTDIELRAKDFYVVKHRNFEIQLNADTEFKGEERAAEFDGTVKVTRSSFYVPALTDQFNNNSLEGESEKPLLMQARIKSGAMADTVEKNTAAQQPIIASSPGLFTQFTGKINISIPRNSWIKGPNILMELEGEVDLVKSEDYFELFGQIGIVRGHYSILGKRFNIVEGNLNFKGGKKINPEFILTADYEFRAPTREKRSLRLYLSGNLDNPTIRFTLDGSDIPKADAVSYMIFGKSTEELSFGEQAGMERSTMALDVATSLLSTQLSKSLGQELQLDYLEIKGKDNWQSATFVVGKYITNELFISYQREFGDSNDEDIAPETVTVEYELTRNIFLQLIEGDSKARGADVIFKVEW